MGNIPDDLWVNSRWIGKSLLNNKTSTPLSERSLSFSASLYFSHYSFPAIEVLEYWCWLYWDRISTFLTFSSPPLPFSRSSLRPLFAVCSFPNPSYNSDKIYQYRYGKIKIIYSIYPYNIYKFMTKFNHRWLRSVFIPIFSRPRSTDDLRIFFAELYQTS